MVPTPHYHRGTLRSYSTIKCENVRCHHSSFYNKPIDDDVVKADGKIGNSVAFRPICHTSNSEKNGDKSEIALLHYSDIKSLERRILRFYKQFGQPQTDSECGQKFWTQFKIWELMEQKIYLLGNLKFFHTIIYFKEFKKKDSWSIFDGLMSYIMVQNRQSRIGAKFWVYTLCKQRSPRELAVHWRLHSNIS